MTPGRVLSAVPDAALGGAFLLTWIHPGWTGRDMLSYALLSMLLEFIVIHSSGFMGSVAISPGSRASKALRIVGLGLFYAAFVSAWCFIYSEWWPMWAFWSLTLNRLTGVLFHTAPEGEERARLQSGWAVSVLLYLFWVFATVVLPLPRLGVTEDVAAATRVLGTSGLWVDAPHRLLAAGAGYYLSQAWIEWREPAWATAMLKAGAKSTAGAR